MTEANRAAENIARAAGGESAGKPVQVVKTEVNDPYKVLTSTPRLIASVLAVVLLTFFFMVYGGDLQRNAIALLPGRQQKKLTVEILQAIETEISRYVLTISIINVIVGLVFAGAAVLSCSTCRCRRSAAVGHDGGAAQFRALCRPADRHPGDAGDGLRRAMTRRCSRCCRRRCTWGCTRSRARSITPIVLGRRMALSPLVLILSLMVFGWLWGIVGLLLAVPLLVCVKLVLARIEGLEGWAKLLE